MLSAICQAQSITNVDANQEGKSIAVTYDLNEMADISLYVTQDGGRTKTLIPQAYLAGDAGKKVSLGSEKKILWRVLDQYPNQNFQGENMSFIVKGSPSMRFFSTLNGGYSMDSGFMLGATVGQLGLIGWYLKGMTTLSFPKGSSFESNLNGYVDETLPAYSGVGSKSKAYAIVGANVRLVIPLYINAGIGYGGRVCEWQTSDGKWVKVKETDTDGVHTPQSYSNLAVDLGLMAKFQNIVVSFGTTAIFLGRDFDFYIGVGYLF